MDTIDQVVCQLYINLQVEVAKSFYENDTKELLKGNQVRWRKVRNDMK